MRTSPILLLVLLATGCTAAKASIQLVSAEQAMLRARSHGADERAEYEYTMALRYLEKAREEVGYSEFRIADALARQSAEWSDRAVIFMERRGKTDFNLDDFTNSAEPPDVPPPPPALDGEADDAPIPIPGESPEGQDADELLEELFGDDSTDTAPKPDPDDAPKSEDFELDDDIEMDQ